MAIALLFGAVVQLFFLNFAFAQEAAFGVVQGFIEILGPAMHPFIPIPLAVEGFDEGRRTVEGKNFGRGAVLGDGQKGIFKGGAVGFQNAGSEVARGNAIDNRAEGVKKRLSAARNRRIGASRSAEGDFSCNEGRNAPVACQNESIRRPVFALVKAAHKIFFALGEGVLFALLQGRKLIDHSAKKLTAVA